MILRSARERFLQTALYELGGLALVLPCYALITGHAMVEFRCAAGRGVHRHHELGLLSQYCFDTVEALTTGRMASDRPQLLRLVHATSNEVTSILVTTPVIVWVAGYGWWEALLVDIGLTLLYSVYAYLFHLVFDAVRPVCPARQRAVMRPARQRTAHQCQDGTCQLPLQRDHDFRQICNCAVAQNADVR